jgi:hypothetical protein
MRFLLFQSTWFYLLFSEILTVPEYLVLSGVLVRFLPFQSTLFLFWNSKNLIKTPDKTRYSGTVRISLKHQIKPGALEQ